MGLSRHDVRIAVRSFTKHRGFTIVAVLSLALAIALNTTMYSVIDAMVNPDPGIRDADRVAMLRIWGDAKGKVDDATRASLLRSADHTIEAMSYLASGRRLAALEYGRRYTQAMVSIAAPNYFRMLGIRPISGRVFVDDDYTASSAPMLLSKAIAAELFPDGALPLGAVVDVDGEPHPVIGVVDRGGDMYLLPPPTKPLSALPVNIVRLRRGVSVDQASRELVPLSNRFAELAGQGPKDTRFQLYPVSVPQFHVGRFHWALIAAVVAVLLVACANLANLQLARGIRRSRELALRAALGATRRDIITQLLLESTLLAGAGLVLGLLLTFWGNHLLASRIPPSVAEYVMAPRTSWRVCLFAMAACALCVVLIGLLPALRVSRVDPNELLKSGAGTGANRKNQRQYGVMVAAEIGLSLALLSGAALVVRSALYYETIHIGYDLAPLSSAFLVDSVGPNSIVRYDEVESALVDRMRSLPDVADAAVAMYNPMIAGATTVADQGGDKREVQTPMYGYSIVSPSYLHTIGLPIVEGRDFTEGGAAESELIIDAATARYLWPNGRALGGRIKLGSDSSHAPWVRVVGIAKSIEHVEQRFGTPPDPQQKASRLGAMYYRPAAGDSFSTKSNPRVVASAVVRAKTDPGRMPITLRRYLSKGQPLRLVQSSSMEERLGLARLRQSHDFVAATFTSFTLLALSLAALGIFGIVTHSVAERKRELGVRIALGATPKNVLQAVLREGNAIALAGVAVGLLLTKETAGWLQAFTFEDDQYDAGLFAAMALVLFLVALISALIPAWRATRIDPVESLRSE